jgi:PIN domain nuclease of toxin-antitoxin system
VRLLLDTQALYWYVEGDPKLSDAARALVQDAANEVFICPASYWEIAIKASLGKWTLNRPYRDFIDMTLQTYGFQILPVLPTHTEQLLGMPFHHNDPFDRLIVAQALAEPMAIVSIDTQLDAYGVTRHW